MTGLASERIEPLLRGRLGRPYVHEAECETTQNLLAGDAPEGAVATADHQRAGRGRHGRRWDDEPGSSLLVSVVLRPPAGAAAAQLSLVCALSVAETVEHAAALEALVKWPNDVLVEGRKIAGILLEGRDGAVVCGIGINVNQLESALPAHARTPAASLRTLTGREHDRALVLVELLARARGELRRLARVGALAAPARARAARRASRPRGLGRRRRRAPRPGSRRTARLRVARADGAVTLVASGEVEVA